MEKHKVAMKLPWRLKVARIFIWTCFHDEPFCQTMQLALLKAY